MKALVGLLLLLLVVGGGWFVWRGQRFDGKTRFTVINLASPVSIESFDPATGLGIKLLIPDNLELDSVGGRGSWQAGTLSRASDRWGMKWAADSLTDYLGVSYTGIAGKLGLGDKFWWWWWSKKVSWETVDLGASSLLTQTRDPDGVVLERLTEQWRTKASEWFSSANLARETASISIVNSTDVEGLGAHAATVIENSGLRVVAVNNSTKEVKKCVLVGSETMEKSLTGRWLLEIFGCDWEQKGDAGNDLNLVLGSDYKNWLVGN